MTTPARVAVGRRHRRARGRRRSLPLDPIGSGSGSGGPGADRRRRRRRPSPVALPEGAARGRPLRRQRRLRRRGSDAGLRTPQDPGVHRVDPDDDSVRVTLHRPGRLVGRTAPRDLADRRKVRRRGRPARRSTGRHRSMTIRVDDRTRATTGASGSARPSTTSSTQPRRHPAARRDDPDRRRHSPATPGKYLELHGSADISRAAWTSIGPGSPGSTLRDPSELLAPLGPRRRWRPCRDPEHGLRGHVGAASAPSSRRSWSRSRSSPDPSRPASTPQRPRLASSPRGGQSSMFYAAHGSIPPTRHTQHRAPDGVALRGGAVRRRRVLRAIVAALPRHAADADASDRAGRRRAPRARGGRRRRTTTID